MDFAPLVLKMDYKDADTMRKALEALGVSAENVERAIEKMSKETVSGMKKSATQFEKFQKKFNDISNGLNKFANGFNTYVTLPLIAAGAAAVKMSNDLNKGMASVATLIPQQSGKIAEYKEEIKDLSIETGKSFNDLTRGLYETISAFPGVEDAIGVTAVATKAARAGLSTTKEALDLLSATTKAYGDTSLEAQKKVADLAFTAVKLGQTTFPEMASAIQTVTERSSALGVSQEELFSVFGTFTGVTGDAAMAATQMRSALIAISNPTRELQTIFQKLGVTGTNAAKQLISREGLQGAFQSIVDASDRAGYSIQKVFRRIEGVTFAGQLTGKLAGKFKELEKATKESAGAMLEAFREQTSGINEVGFTMEQAFRSVQVVLSELGDALAPTVLNISSFILDLLDNFRGMSESTKSSIAAIGLATLKFGIFLKVVNSLVTGLSGVMSITKLLGPNIRGLGVKLSTALGGPALGALAAIAAAGTVTVKVVHDIVEERRKESILDSTGQDYVDIYGEDRIVKIMSDFSEQLFDATTKVTGGQAVGGYLAPTKIETQELELVDAQRIVDDLANTYNIAKGDVADMLLSTNKLTNNQREQLEIVKRLIEYGKEQELTWSSNPAAMASQEALLAAEERAKIMNAIAVERETLEGFVKTSGELVDMERMGEGERWAFLAKKTKEYVDQYTDLYLNFGDLSEEQMEWYGDLLQLYKDRQAEAAKYSGSGGGEPTYAEWKRALREYTNAELFSDKSQDWGFMDELDAATQKVENLQKLINVGIRFGAPDGSIQMFVDKLKEAEEQVRSLTRDELKEDIEELWETFKPKNVTEFISMLYNAKSALNSIIGKKIETVKLDIESAEADGDIEKVNELTMKMRGLKAVAIGVNAGFQLLDNTVRVMSKGFYELGKAFAESAILGESNEESLNRQKEAMAALGIELVRTLPDLMASVGIQLIGTLNPAAIAIGLGLLAGSGAISFALGQKDAYDEMGTSSYSSDATVHNAKGGVYGFANGGAFTNSIVNTPTMFKFAKGTGLMGEAGPEAIMPLSRTPDGRLGVSAEGAGTSVVVNVINNSEGTVVSKEERSTRNGKEIDVIIEKKVLNVLGNGKADGTMKSRWGISPRPYR